MPTPYLFGEENNPDHHVVYIPEVIAVAAYRQRNQRGYAQGLNLRQQIIAAGSALYGTARLGEYVITSAISTLSEMYSTRNDVHNAEKGVDSDYESDTFSTPDVATKRPAHISPDERDSKRYKPDNIEFGPFDNLPDTSNMGQDTAMIAGPDGEGTGEMGGGGEAKSTIPHRPAIWRKFPNTDTAALRWIYTNYLTDGDVTTGSIANNKRNPFDRVNTKTDTGDLINTPGAAWTTTTGAFVGIYDTQAPSLMTGHDFYNPVLLQLRMTTPYNIFKTKIGTKTIDNIVGYSQPNWLEMFDSKYTYYHVDECNWRCTFTFGTPFTQSGSTVVPQNESSFGYYIFWRYTNEDQPPTQWQGTTDTIINIQSTDAPVVTSGTTGGSGGAAASMGKESIGTVNKATNAIGSTQQLNKDDYLRMGGWQHKHVLLNTTHPTQVSITGNYAFGQCKMDVKTQAHSTSVSTVLNTEGWIPVGSTYAFPEDLSIIIVTDNQMCSQEGYKTPLSYNFDTEMITTFKDLRSAYKYPTPGLAQVPGTNAINTDAIFFYRGAAYA